MKYLYHCLDQKERKKWHDLSGDAWELYREKMKKKYFGKINRKCENLDPEIRFRIESLHSSAATIRESLFEYGSCDLRDLHDLSAAIQNIESVLSADITTMREESGS